MTPRVVLLHALPFDGRMWAGFDGRLGAETRVVPSLYRLGDSLEDWAAGVLDLAGDGPLLVVGNSVGGSCALEVARLAPDRVAGIVLIGAKASHRPEPELRDAAVRALTDGGMEAAWNVYWAPLFGARADPAVVEAARRLAFDQDVDDVIRGVRVFHDRPDLGELAHRWEKPFVVVSGDQDRSPAAATAMATAGPRGELRLVEDSGHYVPLEQPAALEHILTAVLDAHADA